MHSIFEEIEAIDRQMLAACDADIAVVASLVDRRTRLSCRLLPSLKGAGEMELAKISEILASTARIQLHIAQLRSRAAEDLQLLERQDQLLHLLQPVATEPCYMDFSA